MADPISASIAAVVTWVSTAAVAVNTAFVAAAALIPGLSFGAQVAVANLAYKATLLAGVSLVSSAMMAPKTGRGGSPTTFKADPNAPVRGVMGRFGTGGTQLHFRVWGKENVFISYMTALSLGPIAAIAGFSANTAPLVFNPVTGKSMSQPYLDNMHQTRKLGLAADGALQPPAGLSGGHVNQMSEWTPAHKASGLAAAFWTMRTDSKRAGYPNGVPMPQWTVNGMLVWQPRFDSTYPGGSGPQRRDDWRTWGYSENPYDHALAWVRGHFLLKPDGSIDRTKRIAGIGAPDRGIDIAAFVEGANVADANGWKIAGEWTTADAKWATLAAMLQAGGGVPLNRGAQISVMVNTPRVSLLTYTGADRVGPVSMKVMSSRRDRRNSIIPSYRDESQKFEKVAAAAVTAQVYLDEDRGEARSREVFYEFVTSPKQAAELAAYDLTNSREGLFADLPSKPYLLGLKAGDAFTINDPDLGLNGQKVLVTRRNVEVSSGLVTLEIQSETDAKHPYALGQTANPPPTPGLTAIDDQFVSPPDPDDWVIVPRPPAPGGTLVPGFDLSGFVGNSTATAIEVQWWEVPKGADHMVKPTDEAAWQTAGTWPPTANNVPINVPGDAYYWIGLIHVRNQNYSTRTVVGPWRAGKLIAGGLTPDAAQELIDGATKEIDGKVSDALDQFEKAADLDGLFKGQDDLAEAVLKLGRGQTELQRTVETYTRDGGKLVKSIVRVIGGELANAQGAIVEEATLSLQRDMAEAVLRQTLALQVDENRASAENSINALVTDLLAEITARNALGVRVQDTEVALSNEAILRASETSGLALTQSLMGVRNGPSTGFILNQNTVQWGPEGTLASVLSGLRATDGANSSSIISLLETTANQASHLTTLSSTVGDNTSSVSVLLSAVAGIGSRWTLALTSNGIATSIIADGETKAIRFLAENLSVSSLSGDVLVTPFSIVGTKIRLSGQVEIDGNALVNGTLTTTKIKADNITIIESAAMAGTRTGNGTSQVALTYSVNLPYAANIISIASFTHIYSQSGDPGFSFIIRIDGVDAAFTGGSGSRVVGSTICGFRYVNAGMHTVELIWNGAVGGLTLSNADLVNMAVFR